MNHFYQNIPGWFGFQSLYEWAVKAAPLQWPTTFVEIGAWKGRSAAFMGVEIINSGKPISLIVVEHGLGEVGAPTDLYDKDPEFPQLLQVLHRNLEPIQSVTRIISLHSLAAAQLVPDDSCQFVFIDGDHRYEAVQADIEAWLPKVVSSGVLAGDDYWEKGVHRAVHERLAKVHEGDGRWWSWQKP